VVGGSCECECDRARSVLFILFYLFYYTPFFPFRSGTRERYLLGKTTQPIFRVRRKTWCGVVGGCVDLLRDLRAWRGSLEVAEVRLRHLEIGGGSKKEKINKIFSSLSLVSFSSSWWA